jgi:holliday junction resolvase YEN1
MLASNEDKIFLRKHPSLAKTILESSFPDTDVLRYYTNPVISTPETIRGFTPQWTEPNIEKLAQLCKELFEWDSRWGMCRFMRSITPPYLVWKTLHDNGKATQVVTPVIPELPTKPPKSKSKKSTGPTDTNTITNYFAPTKNVNHEKPPTFVALPDIPAEKSLIIEVHSSRTHFSTDSIEELRVSYLPSAIISYTSLNFDLTRYNIPPTDVAANPQSPQKSPSKRPPSAPADEDVEDDLGDLADDAPLHRESKWSPDDVSRMWIPGYYIRHTYPSKVAEWELAVAIRKSPKKPKGKATEKATGAGPMDAFLLPGKITEKPKPPKRKENIPRSPTKPSIPRFQIEQPSPMKSTSPRKQSPKKVVPEKSFRSPPTTPTKFSKTRVPGTTRLPARLPLTSASFDDVARRLDEDSDSDSLPSPTGLLSYLPTPRTPRTATRVGVRGVEEGSPTPTAPRHAHDGENEVAMGERSVTPAGNGGAGGGTVGGFWESPGGTFYDLDD